MSGKGNVYDWITERIVGLLEKGVIPWRRPWLLTKAPANLVSGKEYRGINMFWLSMLGEDYGSRWWLTAKQAKDRGGTVKRGQHGAMVVYYKVGDRTKDGKTLYDDNGKPLKSFLLRYSTVFNVEQCEGIAYPKPEDLALYWSNPIDACEAIMAKFADCPIIHHKGDRAFYRESDDSITMPPRNTFPVGEGYYATLFHESAHATGHKSRLNRTLEGRFGSSTYAREELIAEMTAAMLCAVAGIECKTLDNSAAYIENWLGRLKNDSKLVVNAASAAQRAAEYIQGIKPNGATQTEEAASVTTEWHPPTESVESVEGDSVMAHA